jgi:hypothetical protein
VCFILSEVKYRIIVRRSPLSDIYFNNALFAFFSGVCLLYIEIYLKSDKIPHCIVRQHILYFCMQSQHRTKRQISFIDLNYYTSYKFSCRSLDSSVGIAMGFRLDGRRLNRGRSKMFPPQYPDRLWDPLSLISNVY